MMLHSKAYCQPIHPDTWLKNNKDLTQQLDFDFPNIDTGRVWVVFKTNVLISGTITILTLRTKQP